jgi:hypothetical protein
MGNRETCLRPLRKRGQVKKRFAAQMFWSACALMGIVHPIAHFLVHSYCCRDTEIYIRTRSKPTHKRQFYRHVPDMWQTQHSAPSITWGHNNGWAGRCPASVRFWPNKCSKSFWLGYCLSYHHPCSCVFVSHRISIIWLDRCNRVPVLFSPSSSNVLLLFFFLLTFVTRAHRM